MPRIGMRAGDGWTSMSMTGWVLFWLAAWPFVVAWLLVKLLVIIVKAVVALVQMIDDRPAIPPPLRWPRKNPRGPGGVLSSRCCKETPHACCTKSWCSCTICHDVARR